MKESARDIKIGDHVCFLYETEEERLAFIKSFLLEGLESDEKVIYIADTHLYKTTSVSGQEVWAELGRYIASGQISLPTADETYTKSGTFDPDRMLAFLRAETKNALANGYTGLRVTSEMTQILIDPDRLIEYERSLDNFVSGSNCLALCQYDRQSLPAYLLLKVLTIHPIVMHGTQVYNNFYYVPSIETLGSRSSMLMLENWLHNLAKRKLNDEALEESKQFNSALLENSPYPILVINPDTSIRYVNPALEELTDFSSIEIIGKKAPYPWWVGEKKELDKKTRQLRAIMRHGEKKVERMIQKKNGELRWVEITSKPITNNGESKYFFSNWVDITKRKQAEEQLIKLNEELRNLSAHLQSVRENERGRVAREIHDELGQALTALKMDVCWISNKLDEGQESLHETTEAMNKLIDETLQKVKWISSGLRPSLLDDIGLADAVEWLVQEFQHVTGIACNVAISLDNTSLDRGRCTTVFRILQEALTNVFRHSSATKVAVSLKQVPGEIIFKLRDNGKGITQEQISDPKALGLIGMREYIHFGGGKIKINGTKGKGTIITARIPIAKRRK